MGKIFYIMGKSSSGKDTIYERLLEDEVLRLRPIVLYTTRPIRMGEQEGREYHFVTPERLEEWKREGKIIELRDYRTVHGIWSYFTADDGQVDLDSSSYLGIGTLESYNRMREYFGEGVMCPIYIEVEDGERLKRAIKREEKQEEPRYGELCRRFLADAEDFSEENIQKAGIGKRFRNKVLEDCLEEIREYLYELR
ncbi:guanylate kinase [Lactonifactor longoviformis]|uniref:guanylate kinase n=1 Tax=Lactonifactor longoviformis TaxID=341220 RepID=UPI00210AA982|nr:guanylate kinase [Lactonifactor longoviformis]MCQ4670406.1 guanylate kinase [Lactonifactor longoviformis]